MLLDWRLWVKIGLFATLLDGALRKWFFPGAANILYFLKDFVFLISYVMFLIKVGRGPILPIELKFLRPVMTLSVLLILLQGFNPRLGSVVAGIIGIRNYLIFAPLLFLIPKMFRTKQELQNFLWIYGLTVIPIGLLGLLQFLSPPSARINSYVGDESNITSFGLGKTRITGTFSYISGYTTYLMVTFGILLSMVTTIGGSKTRKVLLYGAMVLCVSNMLMTGSRLPVFSAIIMIGFYFAVQAVYAPRQFRKMLPSLIFAGIVLVIGIAQSPAYKSFLDRVNSADTQNDSRLDPSAYFENFFDLTRYEYPGGWGAGAYHPATNALRKTLRLPAGEPTIALEDEPDRVLAELGILGFIFWYSMRVGFIILLWMVFLRMRDSLLRNLALIALAIHLLILPGQLVYQHTAGVYYWMLAGFGALLPRLQRSEDQQIAEERALAAQEDDENIEQDLEYSPEPLPG